MILIENAKVVTENGIIFDGAILTDNDRIVKVGKRTELEIPIDVQRIDAEGLYVGPGFVDIHVHGGDGYMFYENPQKAAEHFLSHGETTVLATLYTSLKKDAFEKAVTDIKDEIEKGNIPNVKGFYMEGPYMNPEFGCDAHNNTWRGDINEEDYKTIVELAGDLAYVWAVAPEREGIAEFMEYVKTINPNTTFAVGHSKATPEEISKLKKFNVKIQTHCMNATGRLNDGDGIRGAGPDEYCFLEPEMYAELISDSLGIHVKPALQRLLLKIKGTDKVVLISDSYVGEGKAPEKYKDVTDLSFDSNGGIAGSKLTMDVACRNIMSHTNCGICQAFLMAATNPAKAVGIDDEIGSLEEGKRANLVFVDDMFNVNKVMLNGQFM